MVMDTDTHWDTDDLALATFLFMKYELVKLDWREPSDCYFVFEATDELFNDAAEYSGGWATVNPREYMRVYGTLKRRMTQSRPPEMDPRRTRRNHV